MNVELKPCPFCGGGETILHENKGQWLGTRYGEPRSYEVQHWCDELGLKPGTRMLSFVGRDKETAIKRWNHRV